MAYRLYSGAPWSVEVTSYSGNSFYVGSEESFLHDFVFKPDGSKMFVVGETNDTVHAYDINSTWAIDSSTYAGVSFYVGSNEPVPEVIAVNTLGSKMYVYGANNSIIEFDVLSAWNIDTSTYQGNTLLVSSQDTNMRSLEFNDDGTKMFMLGLTNRKIFGYNISSAWNISTASYTGVTFSVSGELFNPTGLAFKSDGTSMVVINQTKASMYYIDSAWDLNSARYIGITTSLGTGTDNFEVCFNDDGSKLFVLDYFGYVYEHYLWAEVVVFPEYDLQDSSVKIEYRHKTRGAKEYIYKWADNKKVSFSLNYINSSDRHFINDSWRNNANLTFQDLNNSSDVFSCHIINTSLPIGQFVKPYTNLFKGKIELGSY